MSRSRFLAIVLVIFLVIVTFQSGFKKSWKGELVINKVPIEQVNFGNTSSGKSVRYAFNSLGPLEVLDERDGKIQLFDGHQEGWADKDQFILSRDAAAYFTNQIKLKPTNAWFWQMRGWVWHDSGETDKAIQDFSEAIRLEPKYAIAFNHRGMTWSDKKEYDKAIQDFSEAIRLNPIDPFALCNRGHAWAGKQEYNKAIQDFSEAIRINPMYYFAYYDRGKAWADKQEYDRAIQDFNEAIRIDPNYSLSYHYRGEAWAGKKEYDKAIQDFNEVIRLVPNAYPSFNLRGQAWLGKNEYDKSIKDYFEAIRLEPRFALGFSNLAWILATCPDAKYRDGKKALEYARKACELDPKEIYHIDTLAAAYAEAGQFEEAVKAQKQVLADPEFLNEEGDGARKRLKLYEDNKPYRREEPKGK